MDNIISLNAYKQNLLAEKRQKGKREKFKERILVANKDIKREEGKEKSGKKPEIRESEKHMWCAIRSFGV